MASSTNPQPLNATRFLNRLAALAGLLLFGFGVLFGWMSWLSEKQEHIRVLHTVLELSQKTLDRYFTQQQIGLTELAMDIDSAGGLSDLPAAQRLLRRYHDLHPEAASVTLVRPDAQILASSLSSNLIGLPTLADDPSFKEFLQGQGPDSRMDLSRPLMGYVSKMWVFPMRYTMRDKQGHTVAFVTMSVPVDMLQDFWRNTPVMDTASLGLLRDDGYLLSRYPVPGNRGALDVYGSKRDGALNRHLVSNKHPQRGYVEGHNQLTDTEWANAFLRLDNYPVTVFVSIPVSDFWISWWRHVRGTYFLVALLAVLGFFGYRFALGSQRAWEAERRQSEKELKAIADEHRFLVDHVLAGVTIHGPDGRIEQCNPRAVQLLGFDEEHLQDDKIIPPGWHLLSENGSVMQFKDYPLNRVTESGQPIRGVVLGVMKPGADNPLWLLCDLEPEFDANGALRRVISSFVDITARKNAEQTIERSEHRYRMLYESSRDGVLQTRPATGEILRANPAACAMFGMTEFELCMTGRWGLTDVADPRLAEVIRERDRHGYAQGQIRMRRKDGSWFEAELSTAVFQDESGGTLCSIVLRDVTDKRRMEAALAAQQLAERANLAKSQFVAQMSHELRTPLNAVMGFSDVLLIDPKRPLQPTQRDHVRHIRQAGKHLLSMINDLLDLSRIETGALNLALADVDPYTLVQQAALELTAQAEAAGILIGIDPPPAAIGMVRIDPTRFLQIALNLLSNAIKYNRPGGQARIGVAAERQSLVLSVSDTGLGMSTGQIAALYQPFNRLGRETTGIQGTGIGMVITRNLVDAMDGRMTVASEVDVGTQFRVELPLVPGDSKASAPNDSNETADTDAFAEAGSDAVLCPVAAQASITADGRSWRVLLAEDNPVNQDVACALLGMVGLDVDVAANGRIAVEMATRHTYDVILMDMQMPEMDGLQTTRAIRALPGLASVPIIATTANVFAADRAACIAAGMNDHIGKPLNPRELYKTLKRWLGVELRPVESVPDHGVPALSGIAGLETSRGLTMFGGRVDVYRRAIDHYLSLYGDGLPALEARFNGLPFDVSELRQELHGLGGASAAIGAVSLEKKSQSLDIALGAIDGTVIALDKTEMARPLAVLRTELSVLVTELRVRLTH